MLLHICLLVPFLIIKEAFAVKDLTLNLSYVSLNFNIDKTDYASATPFLQSIVLRSSVYEKNINYNVQLVGGRLETLLRSETVVG